MQRQNLFNLQINFYINKPWEMGTKDKKMGLSAHF